MLEHHDSVAASSLTSKDLSRFDYNDVTTNDLFVGCVLTETKMDAFTGWILRHIKLYAHACHILYKGSHSRKDCRTIRERDQDF